MKPDVLSNTSMYGLKFAEVEPGTRRVRTLCHLSFLEGLSSLFIPPPKITAVPLAESGQVTESHQAN